MMKRKINLSKLAIFSLKRHVQDLGRLIPKAKVILTAILLMLLMSSITLLAACKKHKKEKDQDQTPEETLVIEFPDDEVLEWYLPTDEGVVIRQDDFPYFPGILGTGDITDNYAEIYWQIPPDLDPEKYYFFLIYVYSDEGKWEFYNWIEYYGEAGEQVDSEISGLPGQRIIARVIMAEWDYVNRDFYSNFTTTYLSFRLDTVPRPPTRMSISGQTNLEGTNPRPSIFVASDYYYYDEEYNKLNATIKLYDDENCTHEVFSYNHAWGDFPMTLTEDLALGEHRFYAKGINPQGTPSACSGLLLTYRLVE